MQTTVSLGIDIGGTNIAFGIIDKNGNCLASGSLPTIAYNTPPSESGSALPTGITSTGPSKMRQTYLGKGLSQW